MTQRILITPGEPTGIGPDVTLCAAKSSYSVELIAIADPALLAQRAQQLKLNIQLLPADLNAEPTPHKAGTLKFLPVPLNAPVEVGQLNAANADYVLRTLTLAAKLCLKKKAAAVVTGPVHKEIMNTAGIPFLGHTEYFAEQSRVATTVMLFVVDHLKVALATTHLPLAKVSQAITKDELKSILMILHKDLQQKFHLVNPRILVCGLNPHAGEGGYLGREEIDVITPVLNELRTQQMDVVGPLPADTIFTPKQVKQADAILAMYHDQALPLVKYIGFDHAVNVTLGLPFIRTSVDHGTALDIAGSGQADAGSMRAAIDLAIRMVSWRG